MKKGHITKEYVIFNIITAFMLILLLVVLIAPILAPNDPNQTNLLLAQISPNDQFPMGTDELGRCMFSRTLYAGRTSVFIGVVITTIVFTIGIIIGVIAGYFGGTVDGILDKIITVMQSFPKIILAIAITGLLGLGIVNIIIALSIVEWAEYARMARSYTYSIKQKDFINAARICGESNIKIIFKRIIPNIIFPLIIYASLGISNIILNIAALSYLGVGFKESLPELGAMVNSGKNYLQTDIKLVLIPGMAMFIISSVFNLFGEKLRDRLSY